MPNIKSQKDRVVQAAAAVSYTHLEQQTLVLVQLLLTAVQVNSNSSKGTGNSGQNSDHSDQTRFLHRFNTCLLYTSRCV